MYVMAENELAGISQASRIATKLDSIASASAKHAKENDKAYYVQFKPLIEKSVKCAPRYCDNYSCSCIVDLMHSTWQVAVPSTGLTASHAWCVLFRVIHHLMIASHTWLNNMLTI